MKAYHFWDTEKQECRTWGDRRRRGQN